MIDEFSQWFLIQSIKNQCLSIMQKTYYTKILKIENSKGVRIPEEMILSLGTSDVILEKTIDGILIKPLIKVPPLSKWAEIFTKADTGSESEFDDWEITINDGEDEEVQKYGSSIR